MSLFARKSIDVLRADAFIEDEHSLKRALSATNLVLLGIGAIIGAGIFVLTGTAAAQYAGPAVTLSFIVAGLGCLFAGLCYAEFASMIPVAGSAYAYGYATLGEFIAWIIGTLFGLLAVELAIELNASLSTVLAGVFFLTACYFVWRSFHRMRIGTGRDTIAPAGEPLPEVAAFRS